MKIIIALAFIGILGALASAGWFMVRGGQAKAGERPSRMFKALALRVRLHHTHRYTRRALAAGISHRWKI
jgi:Protein of unknown function (DUF2909)